MTIFRDIFEHIKLFKDLDEVEQYAQSYLAHKNIDGVVLEGETDYVDAEQYVNSYHFLSSLYTDTRCPVWLQREILCRALSRHKPN